MRLALDEHEFSLAKVARAYRAGYLSPVDVIDECLRRIELLEPRVKAWVHVDAEAARRQARQAAEEFARAKSRKRLPPLTGIPIGIKDLIDVAGWPTLAGSRTRTADPAPADSPLVTRLREAGAIILGKTVTTEFACFDPPPTRNPWNLEHTPGGSSSGSCAAVALGMCLGAIGSQTGGSITRPASFCGVAGFKPHYGAISTDRVIPLSYSLDHIGPIARRVKDLKILYRALAETPPVPIDFHKPPRLVTCPSFVGEADPEMQQAFADVSDTFRSCGAEIEEHALPPSFTDVKRMHRRILCAEAAHYHRATFAARANDYGPAIRQHIEEGLATSTHDLIEAQQHRARFRAELAGEDLPRCWLFPGAMGPAPTPETTGDPKFNSVWSYAGCPTISFPVARSTRGLPLAVQVVWSWPSTPTGLFQVARWCERAADFREHSPLLDELPE